MLRPIALTLTPATTLWRAALVVAGSALIALCAQIAVPLPGSPVPVTGQTFAVLLVGAALGSRLGAATVLTYLAEGAAGLPVFAPGGAPGLARFTGPTAGYLAGFVAAAYVAGYLAERGWDRRAWTAIASLLLADAIIYVPGLLWLVRFVPVDRVLGAGLTPFIAGDLYKVVVAAALLPVAWRFARRPV